MALFIFRAGFPDKSLGTIALARIPTPFATPKLPSLKFFSIEKSWSFGTDFYIEDRITKFKAQRCNPFFV